MPFKKHKHYPNQRKMQNYLFPHVCLVCRIKKPANETGRICPQCHVPLTMLSRKSKAAKSKDIAQWSKVEFLVAHGFLIYTAYQWEGSVGRSVPYPATLAQAREFVKCVQPKRLGVL